MENSVGARLEGDTTATAVGGVATFPDLSIDRAGSGFLLGARAGGAVPDRSEPFAVRTTFLEGSATVARDHSCAITVRHFAYCWGANGQNQLGDETDNHRSTTSGVAYCWGSNAFGQLGDSTSTSSLVPRRALQ